MGQQSQARAIINKKYQFTVTTPFSDERWLEVARQSAEAASSKVFGKFSETNVGTTQDGAAAAAYKIAAYGSAMKLMEFTIVGRPNAQGQREVSLEVGYFLAKRSSIPFVPPQIHAAKVMNKFVSAFKGALIAG